MSTTTRRNFRWVSEKTASLHWYAIGCWLVAASVAGAVAFLLARRVAYTVADSLRVGLAVTLGIALVPYLTAIALQFTVLAIAVSAAWPDISLLIRISIFRTNLEIFDRTGKSFSEIEADSKTFAEREAYLRSLFGRDDKP